MASTELSSRTAGGRRDQLLHPSPVGGIFYVAEVEDAPGGPPAARITQDVFSNLMSWASG